MSKLKIKNKDIQQILSGKKVEFPKYVSQILNLASGNAQATREPVIGQLSDLIQEFDGKSVKEWETWYKKNYPDSIEKATDKIITMVENLQEAIDKIDKKMIQQWVEDLVIVKTYSGLKFQAAILEKLSEKLNTTFRLATPKEESKGIDGYIGDIPISIKPISYKTKKTLGEVINVTVIYYEKKKDGISIEYDLEDTNPTSQPKDKTD